MGGTSQVRGILGLAMARGGSWCSWWGVFGGGGLGGGVGGSWVDSEVGQKGIN